MESTKGEYKLAIKVIVLVLNEQIKQMHAVYNRHEQ